MDREWSSESASRPYPPDRTAALLFAATSTGLVLMWWLALLRWVGQPNFVAWARGYVLPGSYMALDCAYGVWLCVSLAAGRRWAFEGMAFLCVLQFLSNVYYGVSAHVVVGLAAMVYCAVRLLGLGPRPVRGAPTDGFLPDRLVAIAFTIVNVEAVLALVFFRSPSHPALTPTLVVYYLVSLASLSWFNLNLYRGHGWTVGVGLLSTLIGIVGLQRTPDQRLQMICAVLGFIYFGLRLVAIGPKPLGILGMRSP